MTLPGALGFATVYVNKTPLLLEVDGVHYDFSRVGEYFVDQRHAAQLLELDEVTRDGSSMESDNTATAEAKRN